MKLSGNWTPSLFPNCHLNSSTDLILDPQPQPSCPWSSQIDRTRSQSASCCFREFLCPLCLLSIPPTAGRHCRSPATRSIEMASHIVNLLFDTDLSDPPSDFDGMDIDIDDGLEDMALTTPMKRKVVSRSVISDDESMSDASDFEEYRSPRKKAREAPEVYSKFEEIPTEVSTGLPCPPVLSSDAARSLMRLCRTCQMIMISST